MKYSTSHNAIHSLVYDT